jgi:hypothetical protein
LWGRGWHAFRWEAGAAYSKRVESTPDQLRHVLGRIWGGVVGSEGKVHWGVQLRQLHDHQALSGAVARLSGRGGPASAQKLEVRLFTWELVAVPANSWSMRVRLWDSTCSL